MSKTYKDYCREAVQRDPKTYGSMFNKDGTRKSLPKVTAPRKPRYYDDIPPEELKTFKKITLYSPVKIKQEPVITANNVPELEIIGTELKLKGRKLNLATMPMPRNPTRQQYNKIWMHNERVKQRIKKLQEQYGVTTTL